MAAGIFVAGLMTLLPAIQRSRERMNQAGCVFNLQQLGNSFGQYATVNQLMPYPPSSRADASGRRPSRRCCTMPAYCDDAKLLDCPCNGPCRTPATTLIGFDRLEHIRRTDPARFRALVSFDYAYNIGYRHAPAARPVGFPAFLAVPVLADQPESRRTPDRRGNSPEPRRTGPERALRRWQRAMVPHPPRPPDDPDLYLNNDRLPRPGLTEGDSVLVPSHVPFHGW